MRKLGIALAIILALALIAVLALPYVLDVNRYHGAIRAELEKRLGRRVSLGPMRLSLFPLAIRVQTAAIAEDPAFGEGRIFAQAEELYVTAELMPLLNGEVRLRSLELTQPKIELVRNAEGVWNFATLGGAPAAATPAPGATQPPAPAPRPQEFTLDRLRITDGQVAITDHSKRQARAVYDHIDLAVENFRPGQAFLMDLAAHLPGQGKQTARLQAKVGPLAGGFDLLRTPIDGTMKLEEVSIAAAQRFLNVEALANLDGIASGEASLRNLEGKLDAAGTLRLEEAKVRGVDIGYPIDADFKLAGDMQKGLVRIEKGTLKLGPTPLSVAGTVNVEPTPAQLELRITTRDASISEVARLAAAFGVAFNPGMKIEGRVDADVHARGAASRPALNGQLNARSLNISGKELKQPVSVPAVELAMSPDALRSNEFTATTGGATVAAQFALLQYAGAAPRLEATVRTNGSQLADVLAIARAYGVGATEGVSGSGIVTLDLRASGPAKDASALELAGTGSLSNASVKMLAFAVPLRVRNADIRFTRNSAVLENVSGGIGETNVHGAITLKNFAAPEAQFTLAADKLSLAEMPTWFASAERPRERYAAGLLPLAHAAESGFAALTGRGTLKIETVTYGELVMSNARSDVTIQGGVIRLHPVVADVYGGAESGTIVIDTRPTPITYEVEMRMERVDANKLLSSVSSMKQVLFGMLWGNADTTFRSTTGSEQIARTLNGDVKMDLRNGKIANMDLWYEIANAGKFLTTGQKMKPFTDVVSLTGDFVLHDGVAHTENLRAVLDGATVTATGDVSMVDLRLNMRALAVLSKERSQEVGGQGIAGYMMTALSNEKGELVIPVVVSGTLSAPKFSPDLKRIAEMKMRQMTTPSGMGDILGGILGGKRKEGGTQEQTPPPGQPAPEQQGQTGQQTPAKKPSVWEEILKATTQGQQRSSPTPTPTPSPSPSQPEEPPEQPR